MIAVTGGLVVGLTKSIVIGKCYFVRWLVSHHGRILNFVRILYYY